MNFNKVIIAGNLTRDPELKYLQNGTATARFALAVNRTWRDEGGEQREEVSFIDCDAWSKTAENLAQYKKKGDPVLVEGRLKQDTWEDKETKEKRSKLKVVAERVVFVGGGSGGGNGHGRNGRSGEDAQDRDGRRQRSVEAPQEDAREEDDVPF